MGASTVVRLRPDAWRRLDRANAPIVPDSTGQKLAYVYFEAGPGRRRRPRCLPQG